MLYPLLDFGTKIDYNITLPVLAGGSFSNKIMIKLEITVFPKSTKYLEFSQSLNSMMPDLKQLCASLKVIEQDKEFTIIFNMDSVKKLTTALQSKELSILSGAIRTLGEKSEIVIQEPGHKNRGTDLRELRLNYSKEKQLSINRKSDN